MSEPFIAEVRMFACSYAPRGWAFCDGQHMAISENTALFAIIGDTYGGDGRITMGMPDLQGRAPMGQGLGPGLSQRLLGEAGGMPGVSLNESEIPPHSHTHHGLLKNGTSTDPAAELFIAKDTAADEKVSFLAKLSPEVEPKVELDTQLSPSALGKTGGNQAHENRQPFTGVNFCIALEGIFPPRN